MKIKLKKFFSKSPPYKIKFDLILNKILNMNKEIIQCNMKKSQ